MVLKRGTKATVAELDALAAVAVLYSATAEGAARVSRDMDFAEQAQQWELGAVLRAAHVSGQSMKHAADEAAVLLRPAVVVAPRVLGQRALRDWQLDKPFWPKADTIRAAFQATDLPPHVEQLATRAYRSLFAHAWRSCFFPAGARDPIGPYSDEEGFQWRRYSTEVAGRDIGGASIVLPAGLARGMCTYNGFGIRTVSTVLATASQQLARGGGKVAVTAMFQIGYADGNMDKMVSGDTEFIRLPAVERGLISGPATLRTPIQFS